MPGATRRRLVLPASATFPASHPLPVWGGSYTDGTGSGRSHRTPPTIDLAFRGTALFVQFFGQSTGAVKVSVDGGAYATVSTGKTSLPSGFVRVTPDLPDGPHEVRLRHSSNGYVIRDALWPSGMLKVVGSAPAILPHRRFGLNPGLGAFAASSWSGYATDGSCDFGSNNAALASWAGVSAGPALQGVGSLRFKATTAALSVLCYMNPTATTRFQLYVDGVASGPSQVGTGDLVYDWLHWTGLDGTTEHEYQVYGSFGGYFAQVATPGGGTINTAALIAKKAIVCYGDSITTGSGATSAVTGYCGATAAAKRTGVVPIGRSGATVHNDGTVGVTGTLSGVAKTSEVTARSATCDRVVILFGTNDLTLINGGSPPYTLATFQSDYETMLSAIQSGMVAGTKICCLGVLNRTGYDGTPRDALNAKIAAAVTSVGGADTSYVSTDGWITPAGDTVDGLHPNDAGHAKVAAQLAAILP